MEQKQGKNRRDTKHQNIGLIIKLISTGQCISRTELSKYTGLSKMAVTNIVSELISKDIIIEKEKDQNDQYGRNPIKLGLSDNAPKIVGLHIFRTYCEAIICDMCLNKIRIERITMERVNNDNFPDIIYQLLDTIILNETNIAGIGVASIGPVDVNKGMILNPYYFFGIENIEIVKLIENRYNLPVFFDHDNQSGVVAEKLYGNGKNYNDIILIGISEGVGCGIFTDNDLYSNKQGLSPEFGHISIDYRGNKCFCGSKGCIESYVRTPLLVDKLRVSTGKFYSYEQFCRIAKDDPIVDKIFLDVMEKLSFAIISCLNILNSDLIILGYDSVNWDEKYILYLEKLINDEKFSSFLKVNYHVSVKKAMFKEKAQLYGAACNVLLKIFSGNILF